MDKLSTGSAMQLLATPENEYLLKHVIRHSRKAMSFRRNLPLNVSPSFQKHTSNWTKTNFVVFINLPIEQL